MALHFLDIPRVAFITRRLRVAVLPAAKVAAVLRFPAVAVFFAFLAWAFIHLLLSPLFVVVAV